MLKVNEPLTNEAAAVKSAFTFKRIEERDKHAGATERSGRETRRKE
jgi:hypothetical protein